MLNRNYIFSPKALAGLGVGLATIFLMMTPLRTPAQCTQWDARKLYSINQSNNIVVKLDTLIQRGPRISGTASFKGKTHLEKGTIAGDFKGDAFRIEIKWDYGETGVYTGHRIDEKVPNGKLSYLVGDAYIKEQPNNNARKTTWRGSPSILCYPSR
jgi:hypothetical protein